MIVGIECTAHTFGVGIVEKGKILANVRDMYKTLQGGIIPTESAKHHREVAERIYGEALEKAGISEREIRAIAISNAPGLAPCLYEGMDFARKKAKELGVPLVGVNHCIAHLEIGKSAGASDPVLLYASGANTQIIAYTAGDKHPRMPENYEDIENSGSYNTNSPEFSKGQFLKTNNSINRIVHKQEFSGASGKYRVFGETLDIGIGNFIDKFARYAGMGFPGGPEIEKIAKNGKYIELPYSIKGMDVSFSGMQTKLQQLYDGGAKIEDLSFSLQETAFAMLVEAAERAMAHIGKKELVLGGGVGCNACLQEMCRIMCWERGAKFFCPPKELLIDNGAMIAYLGEIMFNNGDYIENVEDAEVKPRERTDDVEIKWK